MTASITKPLKWATQRVHHINKATYRIQKSKKSTTSTTASKMKKDIGNNDPKQEIARIEKELAFTYDTIATITVHFESLHHAYTSSKQELDKIKAATRLSEMEKELLTAYDDLGLQVNHLERKITKLEKRITELKPQEDISTPYSTGTSTVYSSPATTINSPVETEFAANSPIPFIDWSYSMMDEPIVFDYPQDFLFNQYYYDIMNQPMVFY
jgi:hypothetical protein